MSVIAAREETEPSNSIAMEWLDRALQYDPESVATRLRRAALYRKLSRSAAGEERLPLIRAAREDLERIDALHPDEPFLLLALAGEWMAHGEFARAAGYIDAVESLDPLRFRKTVLDPDDLVAACFAQAAGRQDGLARASAQKLSITAYGEGHYDQSRSAQESLDQHRAPRSTFESLPRPRTVQILVRLQGDENLELTGQQATNLGRST